MQPAAKYGTIDRRAPASSVLRCFLFVTVLEPLRSVDPEALHVGLLLCCYLPVVMGGVLILLTVCLSVCLSVCQGCIASESAEWILSASVVLCILVVKRTRT